MQKEKETAEDETVGCHHWLNGHESEQTPGNSGGQKSLGCYSPCCCQESDMTYQLNNKSFFPQLEKNTSLTQNLELLVCPPPVPWSLYLQYEKTELVTLEAPPRLPCSVSFNLTNDIMVRGQAGATDSRTRQQDTILTTLFDNCTIS